MKKFKSKMVFTYLRGALGNQMFVYAAARAAQIRYYGKDGKILIGWEKYKKENLKDLLKEFRLCPNVELVSDFTLPARLEFFSKLCGFTYRFCKTPMEIYKQSLLMRKVAQANGVIRCEDGYIPLPAKVPDQILMDSYFQSERYFSEPDMKKILQTDFSLAHPLHEESRKMIKQMEDGEAVCLGIRLGDYEGNPDHQVCTAEYYRKAMEIIRNKVENARFFLFSNNIPLALEMIGLTKDEIICESGNLSPAETLYVMSCCRHFIISNSSFNWWAQYLSANDGKIVIAPSKWYKTDIPCDIYQDGWIKLTV